MKKLLLITSIFQFAIINPSFSQKKTPITISGVYEDQYILDIFSDLEKRYPVKFLSIEDLLKDIKVSAMLKDDPLPHAMEILFESVPLLAKIQEDGNVMVLLHPSKVIRKQKRFVIKGKVTDQYDNPLDRVEISISGLKKTTTSDELGQYKIINVPQGKFYIKYKRVGYYQFSELFPVTSDTEFNVKLNLSSKHSTNESSVSISEDKPVDLFNIEIDIEIRSGTIAQILKEIESKGGFSFSYNPSEISPSKLVVLSDSVKTVKGITDEIFVNTRIEAIEWENKIILKARKAKTEKITISGIVKDKLTGEVLPGATVIVNGTSVGTATNAYGFYSLTVPEWDYSIVYSYLGYTLAKKEVSLVRDLKLDVSLTPGTSQLNEVVVNSQSADRHVQQVEMSVAKLDIKTIKKMPAFMGEVDLIKSILLLPGVSTVGEGATGFNVRGGGIDQNLVLLDEAQVFNTSHLFGLFSVFNSDIIKETKLFKGGIPAVYGGRLSSVLDITQREGNNRSYEGSGGIGIISSRLTLEGPIVKDKSSFVVAGRRSYADVFFKSKKLVEKLNLPADNVAYFYDLNAKINYKINDKNKIFLSGYFGRDNYVLDKEVAFDWGNQTGTLRWNHIFSDKLFSNVTAVYSDYDYFQGEPEGYTAYRGKTGIINYNLKADFTWYYNPKHKIDFGAGAILYEIEPGKIWPISDSSSVVKLDLTDDFSVESAIYISDEYKINSKLTFYTGLRYSHFSNVGPGKYYSFKPEESRSLLSLTDTIRYKTGEIVNNYGGFEPRVSLKFQINKLSSIKMSYNRMIQYLHLVSNTTAATPLDVWKASNSNIKPQIANQVALGYFRNLRENTLEASIELYYKSLNNLLEYKNGADLVGNKLLDMDLLQGIGRAYGIELFINKKIGRLTGWTSYTYSRTERKIKTDEIRDEINFGEWYSANYDQPHKLNVVAIYQLSKRVSLSSNFTYNTGRPATYPDAQYVYLDKVIPHYSTRNQQRIPDYHRLDLSATLEGKGNRWWKGSWVFSVYNLYGRDNAYSVFFRQVGDTRNTETIKLSIIGSIIPSLTYNFKF